MSHKLFITFTLLFLLNSWTCCFAGGVNSYSGNIATAGSAINQSTGSALASLNLEFKVSKILAIANFDETGNINNPIFANPSSNFPAGTLFPVAGSILINAENNLNSKFDLDATSSSADAALIINAMNSSSDTNSQDILIKGALFTNYPSSTTLRLYTSTSQIIFTGGTGTAPRMQFRAIGGIPNGSITTTTIPSFIGLLLNGARRNSNGFSRFAIIGDLRESTIDTSTNGDWSANLTISVVAL